MKKQLGKFKSYKDVLDFFPRSIWEINSRTKELKEIFTDEDVDKVSCIRTPEFKYPVKTKAGFSVFNPRVGINILKIWSNIGDKVIDPFGGRDRALITNYMDRHYTGYEISKKTVDNTMKKIINWKHKNKKYNMNIILGDGTTLEKEKENTFDFCYTCPPYWFKEKYESTQGQLSDIKNENEWLDSINRTGKNLKRVMKKDKYIVIITGDIRYKKKLIPLHSQWIQEFEKNNLFLKDIIILRTYPITFVGVNGYLRNRIMQKSHEYILVFKT